MTPVITLTTDFGHKGPFVAIMKGVIHSRLDAVRIIDLTHDIHVHWPAEAGFWLSRAYQYFPAGTVHVAVVDPGVGTERSIIAATMNDHVFLAPDNGLLAQVMDAASAVSYRLSDDWLARQRWPMPSATFHGRDIFAPLAAEIAAGRVMPADIGPRIHELVPSLIDKPQLIAGRAIGTVIAIDNFGNLITNIEQDVLNAFHRPLIEAGGRRLPLLKTYGHTQPGDYLALINSFGVVEIARAEGNAAEGLSLGRGTPVTVRESA